MHCFFRKSCYEVIKEYIEFSRMVAATSISPHISRWRGRSTILPLETILHGRVVTLFFLPPSLAIFAA